MAYISGQRTSLVNSADQRLPLQAERAPPHCLSHVASDTMRPHLLTLSLLAFAGSLAGAPAAGPTRYLFLDPAFVREAEGAALVVNPPKSSEIVIRADKLWEAFM